MGKYAIFLVLALTFSMLTYSYALRNSIFISEHRTVQSFSYSQAHNIAQSAAMLAINGIRSGDIIYPDTIDEEWEGMNGGYTLEIYQDPDPDNSQVIVQSTGRFYENKDQINGNGVQEVAYTINIGLLIGTTKWDPTFDQALHAEDNIDLSSGNAHIDGDVTMNGQNINFGSGNSTDYKIDGRFDIGPDHSTDDLPYDSADRVKGGEDYIGNLDEKLEYDMPEFPVYSEVWNNGDRNNIDNSQTINASDYDGARIDRIDVGGNNVLTINTGKEGDVSKIIVGEFAIGRELIFEGEGRVEFYVESKFDVGNNSKINDAGDPNQLMLYYRGYDEVKLEDGDDETLTLGGNTIFNGSLYAKEANVKLHGGARIQGNIMTGGDSVEISGDTSAISRLIYAPNAHVEMNGGGNQPAVVSGAVISKSFTANGNSNIVYNPDLDVELPDVQIKNSGYPIAWWN